MAHRIEEGSDGLYALCVFEAENSSDSELQDVFGEFGQIMDLHRANNLVFVRYGSLEEAVLCYEEMQKHPTYRVKPGRKKDKSDGVSSRFSLDAPHQSLERNQRSNDSGGFNERRVNENESSQRAKPRLKPVLHGLPAKDMSLPVPKAKEVVIANIPPEMMQCNVYEMCSKNNVSILHADMRTINRPHYAPVRYAYVYVKTDKDVENIISGLNNSKLGNHQLLVLSAAKLAEECKVL